MMGTADPQPSMFYHINLEQYVTADHPMRKIRPLIDTARIRQLCAPLYADTGRPSIPPEQLFLALLDGDRFEGRFRDGVHQADSSDLMRRLTKEELLESIEEDLQNPYFALDVLNCASILSSEQVPYF